MPKKPSSNHCHIETASSSSRAEAFQSSRPGPLLNLAHPVVLRTMSLPSQSNEAFHLHLAYVPTSTLMQSVIQFSSASRPPTSHPPACPPTQTSPRASTTASSASSSPLQSPQPPVQTLAPISTKPSSPSASTRFTKTPSAASRSTSCTPSPRTSTAHHSTCSSSASYDPSTTM